MKKSVRLFSAFGIAISLVVSGLTPSAQAFQVTVTFDAGVGTPASYTENGMTVTSDSGSLNFGDVGGFDTGDGVPDGSTDLINSGPFFGPIYTFTPPGGQPFDVLGVDIVNSGFGSFVPSSGVDTLAGSLNFGRTFDSGGLNGPGWLGITSFTLQMGACNPSQPATCSIAIDNLVIDVVPEPSTLLLLASGLVGMGIGTRRRSRKEV